MSGYDYHKCSSSLNHIKKLLRLSRCRYRQSPFLIVLTEEMLLWAALPFIYSGRCARFGAWTSWVRPRWTGCRCPRWIGGWDEGTALGRCHLKFLLCGSNLPISHSYIFLDGWLPTSTCCWRLWGFPLPSTLRQLLFSSFTYSNMLLFIFYRNPPHHLPNIYYFFQFVLYRYKKLNLRIDML